MVCNTSSHLSKDSQDNFGTAQCDSETIPALPRGSSSHFTKFPRGAHPHPQYFLGISQRTKNNAVSKIIALSCSDLGNKRRTLRFPRNTAGQRPMFRIGTRFLWTQIWIQPKYPHRAGYMGRTNYSKYRSSFLILVIKILKNLVGFLFNLIFVTKNLAEL
jgi:hypothetical protein